MGLTSSLFIGRSALSASQAALQVTGNNLANAATEGYHRQRVEFSPVRGGQLGNQFLGRGVDLASVRRAIDPSIQARMRSSIAQEQTAFIESSVLDSIEALTNELTGRDLSSAMSRFFNSWSELANNPGSPVTQAAVIEEGEALAGYIRGLRSDLIEQRTMVENDLASSVNRTNTLLEQVAQLNRAVVNGEQGVGQDGNLRDQRDQLIDELSQLLDIQVIEQQSGAVDILVDSMPVVLGATSRGLQLDKRTITDPTTGQSSVEVRVLSAVDQEQVRVEEGRIGALMEQRESAIQRTIDDLDELSGTLVFEVNRIHSSGRPSAALTSITSERAFTLTEQTLAFNDPDNVTANGLPFSAQNGSFQVTVIDENGNESTQTIFVDLDGVRSSDGAAGVDEDTTFADIQAAINGVANLNASIGADGHLRITTDAG
jgi:flagellar hook-associated protein 1 FlgK